MGIIKESQLKLLKRGWVKAEFVRRGKGLEGVIPPPPQKKEHVQVRFCVQKSPVF